LEKSCFKEAIFILQLAKKMLKKQFFGAKIHVFENTLLASIANIL